MRDLACSWSRVATAKRSALAEGRHSPPVNNDKILEDCASQPPPEAPLAGFILAQRVRSDGWPEMFVSICQKVMLHAQASILRFMSQLCSNFPIADVAFVLDTS